MHACMYDKNTVSSIESRFFVIRIVSTILPS